MVYPLQLLYVCVCLSYDTHDGVQTNVTTIRKNKVLQIEAQKCVIKLWLSEKKNTLSSFLSWHQNAIGTKLM